MNTDYATGLIDGSLSAHKNEEKRQRDAAVVTAAHVARDWAVEQMGDRYNTSTSVVHYMQAWVARNGADMSDTVAGRVGVLEAVEDLVDAVWALAELPRHDPLTLVDDDYRGTSDEARDMLTAQYERDLTRALNRITWKA